MNPEKRKREGDDGDTDKMMKQTMNSKPEDKEEEEVEEFFAILRRIHVAIKYFEKDGGSGRSLTGIAKTWKPSFEVEDFVGDKDGVKNHGEDDLDLDLNSEPAINVQQRNVV